jgi:hypothetical protein
VQEGHEAPVKVMVFAPSLEAFKQQAPPPPAAADVAKRSPSIALGPLADLYKSMPVL